MAHSYPSRPTSRTPPQRPHCPRRPSARHPSLSRRRRPSPGSRPSPRYQCRCPNSRRHPNRYLRRLRRSTCRRSTCRRSMHRRSMHRRSTCRRSMRRRSTRRRSMRRSGPRRVLHRWESCRWRPNFRNQRVSGHRRKSAVNGTARLFPPRARVSTPCRIVAAAHPSRARNRTTALAAHSAELKAAPASYPLTSAPR